MRARSEFVFAAFVVTIGAASGVVGSCILHALGLL